MRLLNTTTLRLEAPTSIELPRYAILSHTWGDDEISFDDVKHGTTAGWRHKDGAAKVLGAAQRARDLKIDYIWIDSCCIDKTSSAELSEAINSMYRWYEKSDICFAYLVDVKLETFKDDFPRSRWFTRGWTLQELIAPPRLQFYDVNWDYLRTRRELADDIEQITQICRPILLKETRLEYVSVSCRMAWAVGRVTTRKEDQAYSLMGIFDVNMPLLYGEGEKAFYRLQEEIIRRSNDDSILLSGTFWKNPSSLSILAPSPDCFYQGQEFTKPVGSLSYTELQGTTIRIRLLTAAIDHQLRHVLAILDCSYADDPTNLSRPAILLEEQDGLCTRANTRIYRVTPIDNSMANVKSDSHEFVIELEAVYRRTLTLSLTPVPVGFRRLKAQIRGSGDTIRLNPIMQGRHNFYTYGPCYPEPSGSLIQLSNVFPDTEAGFQGCVSLIDPGRKILRVVIWIMDYHPDFDENHIHCSFRTVIFEVNDDMPIDSRQMFWDRRSIMELVGKCQRKSVPLKNSDPNESTLTTSDNIEVSVKVTRTLFLERTIADLEISCAPKMCCEPGPGANKYLRFC